MRTMTALSRNQSLLGYCEVFVVVGFSCIRLCNLAVLMASKTVKKNQYTDRIYDVHISLC
jgi:hypothetical protein